MRVWGERFGGLFKASLLALAFLLVGGWGSGSAESALSGQLEAGVYTSPDRSFRVRVPRLLQPGAVIRDRQPIKGAWLVEFIDDQCRNYVITERALDLGAKPIEQWVARVVVPQIEKAGGEAITTRLVDASARIGPAVLVRYRHPERAPCTEYRSSDGKTQIIQPGGYPPNVEAELRAQGFRIIYPAAEVGMLIFARNGRVYRLIYVVGENMLARLNFIRVGPVEQLLMDFAEGMELIAPGQ